MAAINRMDLLHLLVESNYEKLNALKVERLMGCLTIRERQYGLTIGHEIAGYKDLQTLRNFFNLIAQLPTELLVIILKELCVNNFTIGHYLAGYKSTEALSDYFHLIVANCPQALPDLQKAKTKDGATIGHIIACHKSSEILNHYFRLVRTHCPTVFPDLLRAKANDGWTIFHYIARYQSSEMMSNVIDMVIHSNESELLSQCLSAVNNSKDTMLDLMIKTHKKKELAPIIFKVLTCGERIPYSFQSKITPYKEAVLAYIDTLPTREKIKWCDEILYKHTPLGYYLLIKKSGLLSAFQGSCNSLLKKVKEMKQQASFVNQMNDCPSYTQHNVVQLASLHSTRFSANPAPRRQATFDEECKDPSNIRYP